MRFLSLVSCEVDFDCGISSRNHTVKLSHNFQGNLHLWSEHDLSMLIDDSGEVLFLKVCAKCACAMPSLLLFSVKFVRVVQPFASHRKARKSLYVCAMKTFQDPFVFGHACVRRTGQQKLKTLFTKPIFRNIGLCEEFYLNSLRANISRRTPHRAQYFKEKLLIELNVADIARIRGKAREGASIDE